MCKFSPFQTEIGEVELEKNYFESNLAFNQRYSNTYNGKDGVGMPQRNSR